MAKADAQFERLNQAKKDPTSPAALAELEKGLASKSNVVAARAASIIEQSKVAALEPKLVAAFDRFVSEGDKGCIATTAVAKALLELGSYAEATFLAGSRHFQPEGGWPGRDAAAELRAACGVALVNMRSRQAMPTLVRLLADKEPFVRASAVRALAGHGGDAAEALVRFKLLIGDQDSAVIGDCMPAIIALTRSIEPVEPFLDSQDEGLRESAMLAVGESRLPQAYQALRSRWDGQFDPEARRVLALAIALTRQPPAIDFLISLIEQADSKVAAIALEALGMYKNDQAVCLRVTDAQKKRGT